MAPILFRAIFSPQHHTRLRSYRVLHVSITKSQETSTSGDNLFFIKAVFFLGTSLDTGLIVGAIRCFMLLLLHLPSERLR